VPGWTTPVYQSRYLSDNGRLFFDARGALVPQDVNGTWDAYQYEPPGVGGCSTASPTFSARSGGCVGLVSSGTSAEESMFIDASETGGRDGEGHEGGGDVFFYTAARLAPQDFDTSLDLYDAHECSPGSPCLPTHAVSPPPCTTGDACKPAPSGQPAIFGSPASATFNGAGNPVPPVAGAVKPKVLTRAQKLAAALKACRKKPKKRRAACEKQARRTYGPVGKAKKSNRRAS
jgi:hypothetical protein